MQEEGKRKEERRRKCKRSQKVCIKKVELKNNQVGVNQVINHVYQSCCQSCKKKLIYVNI